LATAWNVPDQVISARHLRRRPPAEGQQQDAGRLDLIEHEVGDPMRERVGLAGAGAGDDQQGTGRGVGSNTVGRGSALRRVEAAQVRRYRLGRGGAHAGRLVGPGPGAGPCPLAATGRQIRADGRLLGIDRPSIA